MMTIIINLQLFYALIFMGKKIIAKKHIVWCRYMSKKDEEEEEEK